MSEENIISDVKDGTHERFLKEIIASGPVATAIIEAQTYKIISHNREFSSLTIAGSTGTGDLAFNFLELLSPEEVYRFESQLAVAKSNIDSRNLYTVYNLQTNYAKNKMCYIYAAHLNTSETEGKDYYHILMIPDISKWTMPFLSFDTRDLFFEQFTDDSFGTFEWIMDNKQVVLSEGVFKIFELPHDQKHIDISTIGQYVHQDSKDEVAPLFKQQWQEGQNINFELRISTANKRDKVLSVLSRIVNDSEGRPLKLIGSVRDVTGQKAIEEDLKKHVEELNRSNKELEEFAYVASHDLQEPLRKITTFSDRLSEKYASVLTGEGQMYLERMMVSADNMRLLINNLLEFSRITKSVPSFAATNLNFVISQVKNDLELVIEETKTEIIYSNLPTIIASVSQMKQLFSNLISNSIKFRKPEEKAIITITAEPLLTEEIKQRGLQADLTYHKICVADNGIGFENEYAQKIFQIFQRLHGKSEYPGSGIGLAICKKIAEHHHGTAYAESTPGSGAKFFIILPQTQSNN